MLNSKVPSTPGGYNPDESPLDRCLTLDRIIYFPGQGGGLFVHLPYILYQYVVTETKSRDGPEAFRILRLGHGGRVLDVLSRDGLLHLEALT